MEFSNKPYRSETVVFGALSNFIMLERFQNPVKF